MKQNLITSALLALMLSSCASAAMKEKGTYAVIKTSAGKITVKLFEDTPLTAANFIGLAEGSKEWADVKTGEKKKTPFYDGLIFHRVIKDFMIQGGCPQGTGTGGPGYAFEDECYASFEAATGKIEDEVTARGAWENIIVPALRAGGGKIADAKLNAIVQEVMQKQSGAPLIGKDLGELQKLANVQWKKGSGIKHSVLYGTLCMANSGPDSNGSQFFIVTKKDGANWLDGKHTVFGTVIEGMDVVHKIEDCKKDAQDRPAEPQVIKSIEIVKVP